MCSNKINNKKVEAARKATCMPKCMYFVYKADKLNCEIHVPQPLNICFQTCIACSAVSINNRVMFGKIEVRPELVDESVGVPVGDD